MGFFGVSEPVLVAALVVIVVFFIYVLPMITRNKSSIDYKNFDHKNSVAFHHFGGVGGPGYMNVKLREEPTTHPNGKATIWLEGLPKPFTNVNINHLSEDCNCKVKLTADAIFGTRIDVFWNIDANSCLQQWDNMLIQNWSGYVNRLKKNAKTQVLMQQLAEKEFNDEIKNLAQDVDIHSTGVNPGV
jgi:hypothetical protein